MNMPFNDFANTTQYGYRAIIAAFCLVSRFVDCANPSMFPSGWHDTSPQTSTYKPSERGSDVARGYLYELCPNAITTRCPVGLRG